MIKDIWLSRFTIFKSDLNNLVNQIVKTTIILKVLNVSF